MYKFPIRIPSNLHLTVAQPFHVSAPVDISQALKVQGIDHLGVDIVCGTPAQTWGQECVWPFPFPGKVYDAEVDSLYGATQHAHTQIDGVDPETGIAYSLIYLHVSSVTKTKAPTDTIVITYNQGDTVAHIGNNGEVFPLPTASNPDGGSHLHLGVGVKKPGEQNFTMVDPLIYFDVNSPFTSGAPVVDNSLLDVIKAEIQVANNTKDLSVKQSFAALIGQQMKKFFGWG